MSLRGAPSTDRPTPPWNGSSPFPSSCPLSLYSRVLHTHYHSSIYPKFKEYENGLYKTEHAYAGDAPIAKNVGEVRIHLLSLERKATKVQEVAVEVDEPKAEVC